MARPTTLSYIGPRDANGQPLEWFGAVPGGREAIPAADMDAETVAGLSEAQWEAIESATGKRLYGAGKAPSSTASQPSGTAAPTATD